MSAQLSMESGQMPEAALRQQIVECVRMLEQAAGISIYKTRKKEAKQKLDATEQDLARIEDLLFEINNQLKTLENQAKKAEKYFEIKKESSFYDWMINHQYLHDATDTILGLK